MCVTVKDTEGNLTPKKDRFHMKLAEVDRLYMPQYPEKDYGKFDASRLREV